MFAGKQVPACSVICSTVESKLVRSMFAVFGMGLNKKMSGDTRCMLTCVQVMRTPLRLPRPRQKRRHPRLMTSTLERCPHPRSPARQGHSLSCNLGICPFFPPCAPGCSCCSQTAWINVVLVAEFVGSWGRHMLPGASMLRTFHSRA